jgi:hypothetical protein
MAGKYFGTRRHDEFGDKEVLYFSPSWQDDDVLSQSLAICPIDNRELSIIANKLYKDNNHFVHLCLTEGEVEMLINALLEAKKRWKD